MLEEHPCIAYATVDQDGRDRIMLYFKIKLASLDFKKSEECVEIKFYDKSEIGNLQIPPQLKDLPGYL